MNVKLNATRLPFAREIVLQLVVDGRPASRVSIDEQEWEMEAYLIQEGVFLEKIARRMAEESGLTLDDVMPCFLKWVQSEWSTRSRARRRAGDLHVVRDAPDVDPDMVPITFWDHLAIAFMRRHRAQPPPRATARYRVKGETDGR